MIFRLFFQTWLRVSVSSVSFWCFVTLVDWYIDPFHGPTWTFLDKGGFPYWGTFCNRDPWRRYNEPRYLALLHCKLSIYFQWNAETLLLRWRKHICAETRAPGHSAWGTQLPSSKRPHISCPSQLVSKQQVTILDVNLEVAQFYQCVGNGFYAIADVHRKIIFQDDSGMYWFSYKLLSKARK